MALSDVLTSISEANKYIVSANSKLGIAGFRFMAVTEYKVNGQSELTDHRIETGGVVHDYVTNKPLEIDITGTISELYFENELSDESFKEKVADTARYAFGIANTINMISKNVQNVLDVSSESTVSKVKGDALDLWKDVDGAFIENSTVKKSFRFFDALRNARETVTISTPLGVFNNMVIIGFEMSVVNTQFGAANISIKLKQASFIEPLVDKDAKKTISQAKSDIKKEIKSLQTKASKSYTDFSNFISSNKEG